jgi:DnaK suppressor protein
MRKRDLDRFRKILMQQREELAGRAQKALSGDIHLDPDDFPDEIDSASSESGLAFLGRLRGRERVLLQKIDAALEKIEQGTFGTCLSCGEDIGTKRLEARPVATLSVEAQERRERREKQFGDRDDWYR